MAYQWACMDVLSGGRMILGVCIGPILGPGSRLPNQREPLEIEYSNFGITSNKDRAAKLEENITILRRLWSENKVSYEGNFDVLSEVSIEPKPIQHLPPIWIAAGAPATAKPPIRERLLRRVASMADGWQSTQQPTAFAANKREILQYAKEYSRPVEDFPCLLYYRANIGDDTLAVLEESKKYLDMYYREDRALPSLEKQYAMGSPARCIEQIQARIDAGATDMTFMFPAWDQKSQLKRLTEEVLPHFL